MNSPFARTLLMGAIAAVTSLVAAFYYPWPETVIESATVGKPLFESYDTSSVRTMRIMKYDDDKSNLDRMLVRRKGEKWVIPSQKEFIANNVAQYTATANCLNERTVLEERTENQEDHVEYGVVDPADLESTTNLSALGTKVMLEDRQGRSIASLIIGRKASDSPGETKHFVRIPGQPTVYVCEFDTRAIITDFRAWVDPNLFQIGNRKINRIQVENYRLNPAPPHQVTQQLYRAMLNVGRQQLNLLGMEVAGAMGSWKPAGMSPKMATQLQSIGVQLANVQFSDVQRKKPAAAKLLMSPKADGDTTALDSLQPLGFVKNGFGNETYKFNSSGGEVKVETEDGVVVSLFIGNIAKVDSSELQLNQFVMMVAGVNEKAIKVPTLPKPSDDPEKAEQDKKEYLRAIEKRNGLLKIARIRASELNQRFADWVFIVPERVINNLRPDVDLSDAVPQKPAFPALIPPADPKAKETKAGEKAEAKPAPEAQAPEPTAKDENKKEPAVENENDPSKSVEEKKKDDSDK